MHAQFTPVTITGTGVGGWNMPGPVTMDTTDGVTYTKTGVELIGDFNIKFAINDSWATTGGSLSGGFPTGTASLVGTGDNIVGSAGFWDVTIDITTGDYSFVEGVNPNRNITFSGAGLSSDVNLNTINNQDYTKESVTFTTGGNGAFVEIASQVNPSPTANWSSVDFPSGTGAQDGTLIPVAPGTYYIFFDANTGSYDFVDTNVSIVGGFNGWSNSTSIDMTSTDNITYTLSNYTFATSTEIKFLDNHNWNFQFGSTNNPSDFPSGTGANNGTNIAVPAGTYNITFNRTTLAYSLVSLNAGVEYVGSTSTPATKSLNTSDGVNYKGQEITFSSAGSGDFNEVASALNPGPTFFSWPAVTSPTGGFWNVTVDINTGVNSFTPTVVGIIGDFAPSNWGADVDFTSVDGINYSLDGVEITKARANFKIRDNHGWAIQFGHDVAIEDGLFSPMSGTLTDTDTQDMWLAAGTYNFSFNRLTFAYTITDASLAVNKFEVNKFSVYPNPTLNIWNFVSKNDEISSLNIIDILGKNVTNIKASSKEVSVDASSLSKGIYFAKISSGNSVQTFKLVKN